MRLLDELRRPRNFFRLKSSQGPVACAEFAVAERIYVQSIANLCWLLRATMNHSPILSTNKLEI